MVTVHCGVSCKIRRLTFVVMITQVIMAETEIAAKAYSTWHTISIVVDLMCCAAILLPVIW